MAFAVQPSFYPSAVLRVALLVLCAASLQGCFIHCPMYATSGCLEVGDLESLAAEGQHVELIEKLDDERSWVREESARILGERRVKSALGPLQHRLRDNEEKSWVRASAARAIAAIGDPEAADGVVELARTIATDAELDMALIDAVCALADKDSGEAVLERYGEHEDALVAAVARHRLSSGGCGI